jgi:hypothetical protein
VRPYLEKPFTKIGLVEWPKLKVLSSIPSTSKKTTTHMGAGGVVECLPSNHEALSSNPCTIKNNNYNKRNKFK